MSLLASYHRVPQLVLGLASHQCFLLHSYRLPADYRTVATLRDHVILPYCDIAQGADTVVIHATWLHTGTATGRLGEISLAFPDTSISEAILSSFRATQLADPPDPDPNCPGWIGNSHADNIGPRCLCGSSRLHSGGRRLQVRSPYYSLCQTPLLITRCCSQIEIRVSRFPSLPTRQGDPVLS